MTGSVKLRKIRMFIAAVFLLLALTLLLAVLGTSSVYALPEYSNRTGEPCATCHVSPGGGGPRTLPGLLWTSEGRPDEVPVMENTLLAPGINDPLELYDLACAGCHGYKGEGLFATSLTEYYLTENLIRMITLRGAPRSGMPSFRGQLTDEQLEELVVFVMALSDGRVVPPDSYPLPPLGGLVPLMPESGPTCSPVTRVSIFRGN